MDKSCPYAWVVYGVKVGAGVPDGKLEVGVETFTCVARADVPIRNIWVGFSVEVGASALAAVEVGVPSG